MHTIKNNLKSKLFFIRKNLSIYYKKPESYLKTLKEDIEFLSPTLYREIENINYSNLSISYLDNLLTKIINLSVDHENENVSNLNAIKLTNIGGVGDKTLKQLSTIDIISVYDLLTHFPLRYEILQEVYKDKEGVLSGVLLNIEKIKTRNNKKILQAHFEGKSEYFTCVWLHYNNNYPVKLLKSGNVYHMFGNITYFNGKKSIFHPEFLQRQDLGTIRPVYTLPKIVKKKIYRNLVIGAFKTYFDNIEETLSSDILRRYNYPGIKESLRIIHFPEDKNTLSCILARKHPAVQRFIYEELFYLQLGLLIKKQYYESVKGISFNVTLDDLRCIKKFVPFTLTTAQKKVLAEIINDMRSQKQMNRLIQGDVGSGKTIVAMISGLIAVQNGYQVVIIAPTEVLAEQHYNNISAYLNNGGLVIDILTGSTPLKTKKEIKERTMLGNNNFIIGTHALIEEDVVFKRLGLSIIDEQHRFGVMQRKVLIDKGYNPDILLMTATPIPRTLSLTFYGDLDISVIDEMPPGRKNVITKAFEEKHIDEVYRLVDEEIKKGHKAFFIYPLISESNILTLKDATNNFLKLKKRFGENNVGLLHGKMKSNEKRELINDFKCGKIKILTSTTVVEVGIDEPEATIMVIENAERFGLSQLHQLRGRIGRNDLQSYCFLVYSKGQTDEGRKRIESLIKYNDGFKISEIDLDIRGPGDFFGTRQSGLPEFKFSSIINDIDILKIARSDAAQILKKDPDLSLAENRLIKDNLLKKWKSEIELSLIG